MVDGVNNIQSVGVTNNVAQIKTNDIAELTEKIDIKDLSKLYTQDEIKNILKRVGTLQNTIYPVTYSIDLYNGKDLVINNKNMTNDTTEIHEDGSVIHCGSWHKNDIAKEGTFVDIVQDAKKRLENK